MQPIWSKPHTHWVSQLGAETTCTVRAPQTTRRGCGEAKDNEKWQGEVTKWIVSCRWEPSTPALCWWLKGVCKITRTSIHQRQLMYNEWISVLCRNGFLSLSGKKGRRGGVECSWISIYLHSQCELSFPLIVLNLSFNTQWKGVNDAPPLQHWCLCGKPHASFATNHISCLFSLITLD